MMAIAKTPSLNASKRAVSLTPFSADFVALFMIGCISGEMNGRLQSYFIRIILPDIDEYRLNKTLQG
jgi:hypothetical protein